MEGLGVIYQDEWIVAVDKPQGILVHADGTAAPTLTGRLRQRLMSQGTPAAELQPLQRLDVDTSGLVLFSLRKEAQPRLDALVASHALRKSYLAVVEGRFLAGTRTIDLPLGRDRHDSRRMRVSRTGKPSQTCVTLLGESGPRSLLRVELLTGRRHQIRVHLSYLGFPLVGDRLYGRRPRGSQAGLMLHALEEEFTHPLTGERLSLRTPWPERFERLWPDSSELWPDR
ncbi:RluA family pseudouridine synthase [Olsenella urininfantis]|uniref:RluA family pseudouridine synthase n=1 Tax=Olsenella urininfantis TaxID=1871033 RepID=UPI0009844ED5|nr:RluA family pseudouridine synthase [Olsenella urininfantis]